MKIVLAICLAVFLTIQARSQHFMGLISGNYAGCLGNAFNPALMANSRLKADINLFAAGAFMENNYFYLPAHEAGIIRIATGAYEFPYFAKPYGTGERKIYSYYSDKADKNILAHARLTGPSAMFSIRDHVFALRLGARVMTSARQLPYDIANFSYYGMDFTPQHNVYYARYDYRMASMAWYELTFSYAAVLSRSLNNHWSAGISIGPRMGYSGAYINGEETRYIVYNDSILNVEMLDAEMGIALPFDYNDYQIKFQKPLVRGTGWGFDIGMSWQYRERPYMKKLPGNFYIKKFEDYKWKVGLSLTDIGWIDYTVNAEKHAYTGVHNNRINVNELEYDNIRDELNTTSRIFYGDTAASLKDNKIRIYLPTALNVMVDYHITDWWYVNSILVIPATIYKPMIEEPVVIAIVPRFESMYLEFNLPLILYDFQYPRFGLSVRLAGLTIGCDNVPSLFGYHDFTGGDVYFSYKINLGNNSKNPFSSKGACYNDSGGKKKNKQK